MLGLLSSGDDRPVRAIVRGDVVAIQTAAERDGLPVLKVLDGLVVLEAAPSALQALLSVAGVEAISLDVLVSPTMSVSDKAMAADQARAATSGLLLGLLGSPAVSGKGIGVAVVDSGIASHAALTGKVAYSVNFATGASGTNDEFGHGTHIAGIIAGSAASISPTSSVQDRRRARRASGQRSRAGPRPVSATRATSSRAFSGSWPIARRTGSA